MTVKGGLVFVLIIHDIPSPVPRGGGLYKKENEMTRTSCKAVRALHHVFPVLADTNVSNKLLAQSGEDFGAYTNWANGQPSNSYNGREDYLGIANTSSSWSGIIKTNSSGQPYNYRIYWRSYF